MAKFNRNRPIEAMQKMQKLLQLSHSADLKARRELYQKATFFSSSTTDDSKKPDHIFNFENQVLLMSDLIPKLKRKTKANRHISFPFADCFSLRQLIKRTIYFPVILMACIKSKPRSGQRACLAKEISECHGVVPAYLL